MPHIMTAVLSLPSQLSANHTSPPLMQQSSPTATRRQSAPVSWSSNNAAVFVAPAVNKKYTD